MQVIKIYWRDIPSQIIVKKGRLRAKHLLPTHFQKAVSRAAMRAGKGSSNLYIDDWRRETFSLKSELEPKQLAEEQGKEFAASVTDEQLESLVKNKGLWPDK